jgi:lysyl-tRNA synthetase class 2
MNGPAGEEILILRDRLVRGIRSFFHDQGFVEVETPFLVPAPGQEVHLEALPVTSRGADGCSCRGWLHTSPEYAMKRLLSRGMERIFQLCKVWRDGEGGGQHQVEFTMLEWYRAGADYHQLMDDCEALLRETAQRAGTYPGFRRGGEEVMVDGPFERITVKEAFQRHTGIRLPAGNNLADLLVAARTAGLNMAMEPPADYDDLFFRIFLEYVEPKLGRGRPTFLTEYPAHLAALARLKPDDPTVAERFELYAGGLELANAFSELTDANEQRRRFLAEQEERQKRGVEVYPLDEDFLADLERMPPAAGIALGVDRLVMLAAGADTIGQVVAFPEAPAPWD